MTSSKIAVLLAAGLHLTAACSPAVSPIAVSTNTCLFLDDHFIAEQSGLTRTWHPGRPRPEVAIEATAPWEHWPTLGGSCFYDPVAGVYRMYYQVTLQPSGEPGISYRDNLCYAESKDAKTWTKPKLGLIDFNGSKDNNILIAFAGPPCVMLDPLATEPAGRLKMFTYFLKAQSLSQGATGNNCLQSEDGIHWRYVGPITLPGFAKPELGGFNDLFVIGWDEHRRRYLGNGRNFTTHAVGDIRALDGQTQNRRRAIAISTSASPLRGWTPSELILQADEQDDQRAARLSRDPNQPDWAELYVMPMFTYGNHYLGLITVFELADGRDNNGGGDLQLAFSNNGKTWHRTPGHKTAIAPTADDPELFPNFAQCNPPLDMGDEIWLFYSENNGTHGVTPFAKSKGRIRAAVWRKDGFASLDSASNGFLTTKPLICDGTRLCVNFRGALTVVALDEHGRPIQSLPRRVLRGNAVAQNLKWDLTSLKGKPIRLRFELAECQLWSFCFRP